MSAIQIAKELFAKIENSLKDKRFALFVGSDGAAVVTGSGTARFEEIMRQRPGDLVGVYTRETRVELILADLVAMGMGL